MADNIDVTYLTEDNIHFLRKGFKLAMDGYLSKGTLSYILDTVHDLYNEMRDAFSRSEEFLDLEKGDVPKIEQKEIPQETFQNLTQEENALLQNLLQKLGNAKSVQQTTTNA